MSVQAIIANLPQLIEDVGQVRQDGHPDLGAAQAARARGERGHQGHPVLRVLAALLRDGVPELAARLHHHAQRRPDPQGGQGGVLGEPRAARPARAPRRRGRGRLGPTTRPGATGLATGPPSTSPTTGSRHRRPTSASRASSPRRGSWSTTAPRRTMPETIKYLEDLYGATVVPGHGPERDRGLHRHAGQGRARQGGRGRRLRLASADGASPGPRPPAGERGGSPAATPRSGSASSR